MRLRLPKRNFLLALFVLFITSMVFVQAQTETTASALSGSQFNRGNIISDSLFYRESSMSVSSIQSFLNRKVPVCDTNGSEMHSTGVTRAEYGRSKGVPPPYRCLKSRLLSTQSKKASTGLCKALSAKTGQTAAKIIYSVSKACGIDSKVLLVMLQKEQALITDEWPWPNQYRIAMGYGCPDTAPCDTQYYGFFNQVYNAASQMKRYAKSPSSFNYRSGRTNYIQYNPNASCGGRNVYIENKATAGLYNYTPYTPNAATLAADFGEEAPCGAYGNKNFWWYYNTWFDSPQITQNYSLIECSGEKYLVERFIKMKRPLTADAIAAWGFEEDEFVDNSYRCVYTSYAIPLNWLVRSRATKQLYITDSQSQWKLQSLSIARAWGLDDLYNNYSAVPQLQGATLKDLAIFTSTPRLTKSANTGKVYLMDQGILHHIKGTLTGSVDSSSLSLVRGYDSVPMATFSGSLLSDLKDANSAIDNSINAGFSSGGKFYAFDHGKIRWIKPSYYPGRWEDIDTLTGPSLHPDFISVSVQAAPLAHGFRRDGTYYYVGANGEITTSTNQTQARQWGGDTTPIITYLLRSKLL
ncbi:MAG TPA: hypothetical protein PKB09_00265 [Candidatus Saccharibacteria bacterium]|nr:hypothetical protein [Candidatus Saccharibacteria bacterium]